MGELYRFTGTNGSLGLVTDNRYTISTERLPLDGGLVVRIYLTSQPVKVCVQPYADKNPTEIPYMPYIVCHYDNEGTFSENWLPVEDCRCTNPGEDDGATTCWTHHDCTKGECTHGE